MFSPALIEAIHGAHGYAVHGFAANAAIVDDVGHLRVRPAVAEANSLHHLSNRGARSLSQNGRTEDSVFWLNTEIMSRISMDEE